MVPQNYIKLTGAQAQQMLRLVEALEEHDDVQHVYANFDIDESEIQAAVAQINQDPIISNPLVGHPIESAMNLCFHGFNPPLGLARHDALP